MLKEEGNLELQNDWAFKINGNPIHINHAASGLQGYYCMGCNKEMQAVKFKDLKHQSYFRHHAINISKSSAECVYSSREYRERLAEQALHRLKQLKLPAVYKYPPKDIEGSPILLLEASTIHAKKVKSQLTFYEDEGGNIKWGKNPNIEERYLLLQPDVTFFDEHNKPILFIEFVVTHKVPEEKKIKLFRLGINTVQIIIPKLPENEIEESLKSVTRVKWIYNEVESNTEYLPVPKRDSEGISPIDEEQRKLFEESASCRAAQLGNLIRSINRILESQSYRQVTGKFEREISRIEKASEKHRTRLDELEREYEREVYSEFEYEENEFAEQFARIKFQEIEFEEYSSNLEERYLRKREELEGEEELLGGIIGGKHDKRAVGVSMGAVYAARQESLQRDIERIRNSIARVIEEEGSFRRNIEQLKRAEYERFEWDKRRESTSFEQRKSIVGQARIDIESKIRSFAEGEEGLGGGLESEFETVRDTTVKKISSRDTSGNTELSQRIKAILGIRGLLDSYDDRKEDYKRYKSYLEFVRGGTWKKW
ncbi:hypothetical protein ACX0HA_01470 [Flavobacterium hauense]